jgi:hypothetical protein
MSWWKWLGIATGVTTLWAIFASRASAAPPPLTTDGGLPPRWWTDADYAAFAAAMVRDGVAPADALLFVGNESDFNPAAANHQGGRIYAAGLNQITRAGAAGVGVSAENAQAFLDHFVTLSVAAQIPYVERSLKTSLVGAGVTNPDNVGLLYAVNFLPARVRARGTGPNTVLTVRGEAYYDNNAGLDFNKDGKITIQDLSDTLRTKIAPTATFKGALAKLRAAMGNATVSPRFV